MEKVWKKYNDDYFLDKSKEVQFLEKGIYTLFEVDKLFLKRVYDRFKFPSNLC